MRPHRLIWITATLLAASALAGVGAPTLLRASSGDPKQNQGTISVSGSGTVDTQPDTASTSFGVVSQGSTAEDAMVRNSEEMTKVIDALKQAGVADKDIQTQYVSLDPRYDNDGSRVVGYTASNTVSAIVRRLSHVGAVIDAGVAAGANNINGPSLSRDDKDKLYNDALERAVADAKAKAEVLAKASGVSVGAVQSVTENPQVSGGPEPYPYAARLASATTTPIEAGTAEITANVRVVFALG